MIYGVWFAERGRWQRGNAPGSVLAFPIEADASAAAEETRGEFPGETIEVRAMRDDDAPLFAGQGVNDE